VDEPAQELAKALAVDDSREIVAVEQTDPNDLIHTYSVRLTRAEAGEGPETWALREFVDCLRSGEPHEMFGITIDSTSWVGLLNRSGRLIGLTMVRRHGVSEEG